MKVGGARAVGGEADQVDQPGIHVLRHVDDGAIFGEHGVECHHRLAVGPGQPAECWAIGEAREARGEKRRGQIIAETAIDKHQARGIDPRRTCEQVCAVGNQADRLVKYGGCDRPEVGVFPRLDATARQAGAAEFLGGGIANSAVARQALPQPRIAREEPLRAGGCRGGHRKAPQRATSGGAVWVRSSGFSSTEENRTAKVAHRNRSLRRCSRMQQVHRSRYARTRSSHRWAKAPQDHRSRYFPHCSGASQPPWPSVVLRANSVLKSLGDCAHPLTMRRMLLRFITVTPLLPPTRRSRALPVPVPAPGRRTARSDHPQARARGPERCSPATAGSA